MKLRLKIILFSAFWCALIGPLLGAVMMFYAFGGFTPFHLPTVLHDLGVYLVLYSLPSFLLGGPVCLVLGALSGLLFIARARRAHAWQRLRFEMMVIGAVFGTSLPVALKFFEVPVPLTSGIGLGILAGILFALFLSVVLKRNLLQLMPHKGSAV